MTREEQTRHKKGLRRPYGLTIDRDCNIVVMNRGFNKLEIYSPEGQLMMSLGGEGSEPGHFTGASSRKDSANQPNGRGKKVEAHLGEIVVPFERGSLELLEGEEEGSSGGNRKG